jgi:hypothetical protein
MTRPQAVATFINIAFAITIWFAVPIVLPAAAVIGWTLLTFNTLFSLGIAISIKQAYNA